MRVHSTKHLHLILQYNKSNSKFMLLHFQMVNTIVFNLWRCRDKVLHPFYISNFFKGVVPLLHFLTDSIQRTSA